MSVEQHDDFRKRRSELIKTHLRNDPKIKAARRKVRQRIMLGVLSYTLVLAITLMLAKSVTMAMHDTASYRQLVAPVAQDLPPTHIGYIILMPDPLSTHIADFIRPYLNAGSSEFHASRMDSIAPENSQTMPLTVPLSLQD